MDDRIARLYGYIDDLEERQERASARDRREIDEEVVRMREEIETLVGPGGRNCHEHFSGGRDQPAVHPVSNSTLGLEWRR